MGSTGMTGDPGLSKVPGWGSLIPVRIGETNSCLGLLETTERESIGHVSQVHVGGVVHGLHEELNASIHHRDLDSSRVQADGTVLDASRLRGIRHGPSLPGLIDGIRSHGPDTISGGPSTPG